MNIIVVIIIGIRIRIIKVIINKILTTLILKSLNFLWYSSKPFI